MAFNLPVATSPSCGMDKTYFLSPFVHFVYLVWKCFSRGLLSGSVYMKPLVEQGPDFDCFVIIIIYKQCRDTLIGNTILLMSAQWMWIQLPKSQELLPATSTEVLIQNPFLWALYQAPNPLLPRSCCNSCEAHCWIRLPWSPQGHVLNLVPQTLLLQKKNKHGQLHFLCLVLAYVCYFGNNLPDG